ncbi:hypothetical protein LCGC14_1095450 [marine sediment metagenome]|uniref:N-acetyltransferase n=2 Tax=root TaxID=1 RepID=A0A831VN98_9FLAO|nr:N-acetyltransferase [Pricia antarctica]
MSFHTTFKTERLIIRPTSEEDAEFIFKLMNTQQWQEYIGDRNIKSVEIAETYVKSKILPQFARLGYGNYTIIRNSDKAKIGTCGLFDREGLNGIDIGFAFLPEYGKLGFAFEAAERIIIAGFTDFGLKTILAITTEDNSSSQKLLTKLGLEAVGTTELPNDSKKLLLYSIENKS